MASPITAISASIAHTMQQLQSESAQSLSPVTPASMPASVGLQPESGFSALIKNGLALVTHAQNVSGNDQKAFASGAPNAPSLAETMLAGQKADIAFQEMIGIRNELARGYETLITMPV